MRQKSRDEVLKLTIAQGIERQLPDTDCLVKTLNTPHNHGILITNGEGSLDKTVEVHFKFTKVNYRISGEDESVDEVCKVLKPGTQEFIMLEKVDQNQPA